MYTSPNKSLEFADLKRSLAGMSRTKSGRVSKRRRRKRTKKSSLPKVVKKKIENNMKKLVEKIPKTITFIHFMHFRELFVHREQESEGKEEEEENDPNSNLICI